MALMNNVLWNTVNGSEHPPDPIQAERHAKFVARRDCALAIIVLSVEPSLLCLTGDPEDTVTFWQMLTDEFQKGTWDKKWNCRVNFIL